MLIVAIMMKTVWKCVLSLTHSFMQSSRVTTIHVHACTLGIVQENLSIFGLFVACERIGRLGSNKMNTSESPNAFIHNEETKDEIPQTVTYVKVNPSVQEIPTGAFRGC
jgi:hypothetical protein